MDKKSVLIKQRFLDIFEAKIIFIIIFTSLFIGAAVFSLMSFQSRQNLVDLLKDRSEVILNYVETFLDKETFSVINAPGDMETPLYKKNQYELEQIRQVADLKYFSTFKRDDQGALIYVLDSQDNNAPGFCLPGQPLEEALRDKAELVLEGKKVFGNAIQNSGYGPVYITLWPVFEENRVIGGIVLEYDAGSIYYLDNSTFFFSALIGLSLLFLFSVLSSILFKAISRPFHKKMAYTDLLTGLNNRTAFELDKKRIQGNLKNYTPLVMLMFDLNNLKEVNDTLGHSKGDLYLVTAAHLIQKHFGLYGECYRIGGDEFCVITARQDPEVLGRILEQGFAGETEEKQGIIKSNGIGYFAIASGMAVYDKNIHRDLYDVFILADERMYAKKRQMKMKAKGE
ncbi:MAG: GGDEF domain-containing protein [Treponema sp.]|nr:GGDEF domain-containing protein [Treponema sp.]